MKAARLCMGAAAAALLSTSVQAQAPHRAAAPARPIGSPTATEPGNTQTTAQSPAQAIQNSAGGANNVAEVVVTGSLVRGAAEQAALPVQVIGQEDLQKQGAPSVVEIVKALPSTGGVIGDANGFAAGRTEGSASINLRDLGANRTLVLFNGRRQVETGAGGFVDLNMFPPAAIGRVEVLKDGAAATYGSDAIGGVVNFITRKNFRGGEIGGDRSEISGSYGDYTLRGAYGASFINDRLDVFVAGGFQHRAQLSATERDFSTPKFTDQAGARAAYIYNPQGGWSGAANPGTYASPGATSTGSFASGTTNFVDPGCQALGEFQTTATACLFRYIDQYNLVEEQNLAQIYGELNFKVTDKINFHLETLAGHTEVFHIAQTASYGPNSYPTSLTLPAGVTLPVAGGFFIPASNPGLATLLALNPTLAASIPGASRIGVVSGAFSQRPLGIGGNPLYDFGAQENKRFLNQYRVSGDLNGTFDAPFLGEVGWDVAVTYGRSDYDSTNPDFLVDRLELAYRGLGSRFSGPQCDPATGTPGQGNCYYFNPFSTGVSQNPITNIINPQYTAAVALDPRVVNDKDVIAWIYGPDPQRVFTEKQLLVVDGLVNGSLPFKLWSDDTFKWAVGYQFREADVQTNYSPFTDRTQYPCTDSILNRAATCSNPNGPYTFYGNYNPVNTKQETNAIFGELDVSVVKDLQLQFAVRHEDGDGGETTNPKVAARWQALPWLAFRGSAGSTFRAAPVGALNNNAVTGLSFVSYVGSYRPFDNYGNPNLKPETADTYSAGGILNFRNFSASLDYYRFEFANPIGGESGNNILAALFPTAGAGNCANPAYAGLVSRVTFVGGVCGSTNIARVRTMTINGAAVTTDGLDGAFDFHFRDPWGGGRINLGGDVTYTLNFKVGPTIVEGITTISGFNATGKLNYQLAYNSLPRWKGQFFAEYGLGRQNLRFTVKYIDGMTDQRDSTTFSQAATANNGTGPNLRGKFIPEFITVDAVYRLSLPWDTIFTFSVVNMFDEDPPFARLDYSYDPFTANPLGRVYKFGLLKRF